MEQLGFKLAPICDACTTGRDKSLRHNAYCCKGWLVARVCCHHTETLVYGGVSVQSGKQQIPPVHCADRDHLICITYTCINKSHIVFFCLAFSDRSPSSPWENGRQKAELWWPSDTEECWLVINHVMTWMESAPGRQCGQSGLFMFHRGLYPHSLWQV